MKELLPDDLKKYANAHAIEVNSKIASQSRADERALIMFKLHYDQKLTYAVIGKRMGITRQRVCQILKDYAQRAEHEAQNITEVTT